MSVIHYRRSDADALREAPPAGGASIRRAIPDDARGINFEVGKMVQYVRHFSSDPLVVKTSRRIVEVCKAKDKLCEMNALFLWVKANVRYVNDPVDKEVVTTPARMIQDIMLPPEALREILGPSLIRQMEGFGLGESILSRTEGRILARACFKEELSGLKPRASEDCDSGATLLATMLAAVGIVSRFRFGGHEAGDGRCQYYHVWVQAQDSGGDWVDMDVTEEKSKLGWFFDGFGCFGVASIFQPGS